MLFLQKIIFVSILSISTFTSTLPDVLMPNNNLSQIRNTGDCITLRVPMAEKDGFLDRIKRAIQVYKNSMAEFNKYPESVVNPMETRRRFIAKTVAAGVAAGLPWVFSREAKAKGNEKQFSPEDLAERICKWLAGNVAFNTKVPLSFQIPKERRKEILEETVNADERMVLEQGLVIYDGAAGQIMLAMQNDLRNTEVLTDVLWKGRLGDFQELHASKPPFVYRDKTGKEINVSNAAGKRGFRFKIINSFGHYKIQDSVTGEEITWSQWQPVAGENAWAGVLGPMQVYFQKYGNKIVPNAVELKFAEETARVTEQADNGGIRMAPKGTWSDAESGTDPEKYEWMQNEISTENNLSWYAAFRMLYAVTKNEIYKARMEGIEKYLKASFDKDKGIFYQGWHYYEDGWKPNRIFATDCQTWAIDVLGPKTIDEWFGEGAAYRMWEVTRDLAGICDEDGNVLAVDFTARKEVKSVEWTAGAILACSMLAEHYNSSHSNWAEKSEHDAVTMYTHMDTLKTDMNGKTAYVYADKRAETRHGWFAAGGIFSMASTAWMGLLTIGVNPFFLGREEIPRLVKIVQLAGKNIIEGNQAPAKPEIKKTKSMESDQDAIEGDLWSKGIYGEYASSQWKSKAVWREYKTLIPMKKGQTLRIEYELEGSDVMGVQLVGAGQSEESRGDMMVLKGIGKKQIIDIVVPSDRQVKRIAFQIGGAAWGHLGGSINATILIKSIKFLPKGKLINRAMPGIVETMVGAGVVKTSL